MILIHPHILGIQSNAIIRHAALRFTLDPNRTAIEKECKLPTQQIVTTLVHKLLSPATLLTTFPRNQTLINFTSGKKGAIVHCRWLGTLKNKDDT